MVELDPVLAASARRGEPRGADAVWAAAVASLVEPVATVTVSGPASIAGDFDALHARPRRPRAARALAAAAAAALLVAGGVARWSHLRAGAGQPASGSPGSATPARAALSTTSSTVLTTASTVPASTVPVTPQPDLSPTPEGTQSTTPGVAGAVSGASPTRLAVFGDSTALMVGIGLQGWGFETGLADVSGAARLGCPLVTGGERQLLDLYGRLVAQGDRPECVVERWTEFLADHPADVAVVEYGLGDLADWRASSDEPWVHLGADAYDARASAAIGQAMDVLSSKVRRVAWVLAPEVTVGLGKEGVDRFPGNDPARVTRFNELVRQAAAGRPGVTVIDLPSWMAANLPGGELDQQARSDGLHFSAESATAVARQFLGPQVLAAAR